MRKLAYKVEKLSWDSLPSFSMLRKLCFCLFQSSWQNFYWLWRNQSQSLFPYNSVNFGLKNTYSTTKLIWRKLQNIAACRRPVRLLTAILYHQRQINLLREKQTGDLYSDCFHILFIISAYSLQTTARSSRNIRVCSFFTQTVYFTCTAGMCQKWVDMAISRYVLNLSVFFPDVVIFKPWKLGADVGKYGRNYLIQSIFLEVLT